MWDEYESVKVCGMSVRGMDGRETYQHFSEIPFVSQLEYQSALCV